MTPSTGAPRRPVWVWTAEVTGSGGSPDLLDDQERARAARCPAVKRPAYLLAHSLRRLLLGWCLGVRPDALVLTAHASTGCPHPVVHGPDRWFHSLSHSGPHVAVAVSANRRVGVDIERPRARRRSDALVVKLLPHSPDACAADVLDAWVRWEALAKATGEGLLRNVHPVPDTVTTAGNRWQIRTLPHARAHLALAVAA